MPSQDKLIKQGILLTDNLFDEIAKRLSRGVKASDTLEAFLNQTKDYTTNNPLVLNGYKDKMLELILQETNNHKFSRPAQRELTRATIEKRVGDRIVNVGEDIITSVRDIVKWGYNNNKSQDEIADEITHGVDVIKNTRARTIARTEIARTASASDYVINKERGATHFTVDCRDTCCTVCRKDYNFGNVEYTIDQVEMLPPRHPNCRCYARYSIKGSPSVKASKKPYPAQTSAGAREPTKEQLSNNLTAMERSKYANYKRLVDSHTKWLNDNPDAPANQIDNHKKKLAAAKVKLNELKAKALGGSVPASKPKTAPKPKTPKAESKPKATPKKPKTSSKPKASPKTKTGGKLPKPTAKQLREHLTPDELKKYKRYQKEIKEGKLSDAMIARRKQDLENLTRKALGLKPLTGTTPKPAPKKTSAPKKPKTTFKPKTPTTQPETEIKTPTSEQVKKNLTKKEQEEFKDLKVEVKWAHDVINSSTSSDKQKSYAKNRLKEITPRWNELNKKALGLAPKQKRKRKTKSTKKTKEPVELDKPKNARLTKEECDSLTFEQLAEHHEATYKGLVKIDADNNKKEYHVFEQTFDNGETFTLHFEKGAVASYKNGGVATANEIIHECFKVPESLRKETNKIYFRNSQQSLEKNAKGKFKSFKSGVGGHNTSRKKSLYNFFKEHGRDMIFDPDHQICINPKSFKKLKGFFDILTWRDKGNEKTSWKHIIHHEFTHSIDTSRDIWRNDKTRLSSRKDYIEIENAEPDFTSYAHDSISEAFAEHGGYISYMLANPEEQSKVIKIKVFERDENGRQKSFIPTEEEITFEEYKRRFPKHYEYFTKLLKEGVKE